jgi:hypothetical protein
LQQALQKRQVSSTEFPVSVQISLRTLFFVQNGLHKQEFLQRKSRL